MNFLVIDLGCELDTSCHRRIWRVLHMSPGRQRQPANKPDFLRNILVILDLVSLYNHPIIASYAAPRRWRWLKEGTLIPFVICLPSLFSMYFQVTSLPLQRKLSKVAIDRGRKGWADDPILSWSWRPRGKLQGRAR